MTQTPLKPCKKHGCPNTTRDKDGYCMDHKGLIKERVKAARKKYDAGRDPRVKMWLNSARYQHRRKAFLESNPLCVDCAGRGKTKRSSILDHIQPHKGNYDLFWDQTNWQALCHACHNVKTNRYDGGFGNKPKQ